MRAAKVCSTPGCPEVRIRTRTCLTCQKDFSYPMGQGNDRKHCSAHCRRQLQKARADKRRKARGSQLCALGCGRLATRRKDAICEACYCYQRRTGRPGPAPRGHTGRYVDSMGYVVVNVPGHPLAKKDGLTREHRVVAYQSHEGQCPDCFWCGTALEWDCAVVDHLNEQKGDNSPSNLVVSCNGCNRSRGGLLPFVSRLSLESLEAFILCVRQYHAAQVTKRIAANG